MLRGSEPGNLLSGVTTAQIYSINGRVGRSIAPTTKDRFGLLELQFAVHSLQWGSGDTIFLCVLGTKNVQELNEQSPMCGFHSWRFSQTHTHTQMGCNQHTRAPNEAQLEARLTPWVPAILRLTGVLTSFGTFEARVGNPSETPALPTSKSGLGQGLETDIRLDMPLRKEAMLFVSVSGSLGSRV